MFKSIVLSALLLVLSVAANAAEVAKVRVYKAERKLTLLDANNNEIKTYAIMLGRSPIGHKVKANDNKTPEGAYLLDWKNANSKYNKAIHVNYPNAKDIANAKKLGVNPGGEIMVHGLPNKLGDIIDFLESVGLAGLAEDVVRIAILKFDWTRGCIAVMDSDIEEIYKLVKVPTPIFIYP